MATLYYIATLDEQFSITKFNSHGYDIGPNTPMFRKIWKTEAGARKALLTIRRTNPTGGSILQVHQVEELTLTRFRQLMRRHGAIKLDTTRPIVNE